MAQFTASTLTELLKNTVTLYPDRIAISCEGVDFSYAELNHYSDAWAAFFQHQGLKLHDRVALILPNLPQFPIVLLGILKAGGIAVNLNPLYTSTELRDHLHNSGARFVIALTNVLPALLATLPLPSIEHIIVASPGDLLDWKIKVYDWIKGLRSPIDLTKLESQYAGHWWHFLDAQDHGEQHRHDKLFHEPNPEDIALVQYTAGTVSASKGVMLRHRNLLESTFQALERIAPVFEAKLGAPIGSIPITAVTAIPLYHIFGLTAGFIAPTVLGGCARLVPDPRNNAMLGRALSQPFHAIVGVTTLFNKLLSLPDFADHSFKSLCLACNGGMILPTSIAERWKLITGAPMLQGYGLTETAAALTLSLPDSQGNTPAYHAGKPFDRTEIEIRHTERNWTHPNEVGEIWARGPQIMAGYWNRPEETQACFDTEGWFNTGDLGFWDTSGHLHWIDRKKDVVDVSGFMVWPSEIESIALTYPGIREAVAYGVPNLHQGESVHLAITLQIPISDFSVQNFLHHCQQHLAAYKIPSQLVHYESLPRNSIGKIRRTILQDHAMEDYPTHIAECTVLKHNDNPA